MHADSFTDNEISIASECKIYEIDSNITIFALCMGGGDLANLLVKGPNNIQDVGQLPVDLIKPR
jgi:hypothetical protein